MGIRYKKYRKERPVGTRRKYVLPAVFLLSSSLLMILPLEGFVSSVKALLSYIFIPQVRAAHGTVKYTQGVYQTVWELLNVNQENHALKQQVESSRLLVDQAERVMAENERLTELLALGPQHRWKGVWAHVAYREPTQWNTVIIDKGTEDGISVRSAVLSLEKGKEGLVGVVVEVTETTAKVLLVSDEDFSASVQLSRGQETGLLQGGGLGPVRVKYIPLLAQVKVGDEVYTASSSSIFPAGILVGRVSAVREDTSFQTALTVEVEPQVRTAAVKELFILTDEVKK